MFLVVVHKIYQFADAGEEGEFGVGGGAKITVEIVQKLAIVNDVLDGLFQVVAEELEMSRLVCAEFGIGVDARQTHRVKDSEIVVVGWHQRTHCEVAFSQVEGHPGEEGFDGAAVGLVFRDDEDAGSFEFEHG